MGQDSKIKNLVIAIDGYSASGKTTLTKKLSEYFDFPYLLTGNLYRVLAKKIINIDFDSLAEKDLSAIVSNIKQEDLESSCLNSNKISLYASEIAKNNVIRKVLTHFQKSWIKSHKISIVEGRDIGTVICPNAIVKLFLTASAETRAKRRFLELQQSSPNISYTKVLEDIKNRDLQDSRRENSPLKMANDAILIDSSNEPIENILDIAINIIKKKLTISSIQYSSI